MLTAPGRPSARPARQKKSGSRQHKGKKHCTCHKVKHRKGSAAAKKKAAAAKKKAAHSRPQKCVC